MSGGPEGGEARCRHPERDPDGPADADADNVVVSDEGLDSVAAVSVSSDQEEVEFPVVVGLPPRRSVASQFRIVVQGYHDTNTSPVSDGIISGCTEKWHLRVRARHSSRNTQRQEEG